MSNVSPPANAAKTPENDPNSSLIYKVRTRVTNILPNSLSKWFSSSADRNGNLRRKRESETDEDDSINRSENEVSVQQPNSQNVGPPPSKRCKTSLNVVDQTTPTSVNCAERERRHLISSTPTTSSIHHRKSMTLGNPSSPYNFSTTQQSMYNNQTIGQQQDSAIDNTQESPLDSTDEDLEDDEEIEFVKHNEKPHSTPASVYDMDSKRLKIAPTVSGSSKRYSLPSTSRQGATRDRYYLNALIEEESNNGDADHNVLNGNSNESESDESVGKLILPNRPQSSAGRINTTVQTDEVLPQHRLGGLFGTGNIRHRIDKSNSGGLNFSSHLQNHKSLFSDKNLQSNSLNNSTISLTSLNRRQSFNPSIYGSTSALSDSRLLNTNSPFYTGRTMYGGASAYSRRASLTQRTLRVPTQLRPASSLSTLCSSNNSLGSPDLATSALSTTAKRILELINKSTTPLAEVKKMASSAAQHVPPLAINRKAPGDNDLFHRSTGPTLLMSPRTPYSRPETPRRQSPLSNELQVPSMSQLLQMKKKLQNDTEKVRELASGSSSILNKEEEYKLPDVNVGVDTLDNKRVKKIRNKVTTRNSKPVDKQETIEPVNLPNIPFPQMKSMPLIDISVSSGGQSKIATTELPKSSNSNTNIFSSKTVTTSSTSSGIDGVAAYAFSTPLTESNVPGKVKDIKAYNKFTFCVPLTVDNKPTQKTDPISSTNVQFKCSNTDLPKKLPENMTKPELPPLKKSSCLGALKDFPLPSSKAPASSALEKLKSDSDASTTGTHSKNVSSTSLSDMFKSNKANNWECSICMIRNDNSKTKCVACETPKPTAGTSTPKEQSVPIVKSTFGDMFKASSDQWECSVCMIRNKDIDVKCVACETPKPGSSQKLAILQNNFKTTDEGFKNIVADQNDKWECAVCMTRNDAQRKKCICCEEAKPGSTVETVAPTFSFGSSGGAKFSFGVPKTGGELVVLSTSNSVSSTSVTSGFTFGNAATNVSSSMGPKLSTTTTAAPTFSFGKPLENQAPVQSTGFTFGGSQQSITKSSTEPTSTTIVTSAPKKDLTDSSLGGFNFGQSTAKVSNEKSNVDQKVIQSKAQAASPLGGFKFGQSSSNISTVASSTPALFGTTSAKTDDKSVAPKSLSEFRFGSSSTTETVKTAPVTISKNDEVKSLFEPQSKSSTSGTSIVGPKSTGGFSFGSSSTIAQTATESPNKSNFSFGATNVTTAISTVPTSATSQATTLSSTVPSSTNIKSISTPAFSKPATEERKDGFAFGASSSLTQSDVKAPGAAVFGAFKSGSFSFGSGSSSKLPASTGPSTTATTTDSPVAKSSSFVFGSTSGKPNVPAFNTATATTTAATTTAPANFLSTTPAPSFGSGASLFKADAPQSGQSSTGSTSSSPFVFNSGLSSTTVPNFGQSTPTFGQSQQQQQQPLPSFGSFGSGISSNATPSPSFGSAPANTPTATPSFGATTSAANAPQATPVFGAFGSNNNTPSTAPLSATPSFGAGSNMFGGTGTTPAATPAFGAASSGVSPFGSTPSTNLFGSGGASSGFSSHTTPENSDEPLSKKPSGFNTVSSTNAGAPPPYAFGGNNSTPEVKKPFMFSPTTTPSFNFSSNPQASQQQQFAFGTNPPANTAGIFNFGGGGSEATPSPSAPFQFSAETNNNPFAPQQSAPGSHAVQQRRKIRAVRRTPR